MASTKNEESFPRGRSASTKPALRKVKDRLFRKHKKLKKKPFKSSFLEDNQIKGKLKKSLAKGNNDTEPIHIIRPLTYWNLEEGMVVVGRIREVHPFHIFICLPGRLSAKVTITAISEPYSNALSRLQKLEITQKDCPPLAELFTVGQTVVCSIMEVKKDGNVLAVNASLDPALVNKERSHHFIRAGHTLVAAVQSIEDHGYTLYTGIGGLTAFLKFGNASKYVELRKQGKPLVVGELVRCVVTKCTSAKSASRAEVTLEPRVVSETVVSEGNIQTLHPGTQVSCVVEQSSKAGLVVNIGHIKAYIEATHLSNCWASPKFVYPEQEVTATVIYSLPNTDFQVTARPIYLTLKDLSRPTGPKLDVGNVVEATVSASGSKGLTLCLGEKKDKALGNKGFVSIRRLGEIISKEKIPQKFPKGTVVTTKILGFDYMEEIYNCTLESAKLEQPYVSISQVKVGDRMSCRVVEVEAAGLKLVLGPIRLYAFKEHSADVPYNDLRQHYSIGDIVDARVLRVHPDHQVYVTLKETLIRSPALTSYEMAKKGDSFWGTVRSSFSPKSLLVTFYNDIAGVLDLGNVVPSDFKEGQLVKCYVRKVIPSERKLTLGLTKSKVHKPVSKLSVGEIYQVVVSSIGKDHLKVSPCDFEGIEGLIPKCHLQNQNGSAEGDFIRAWLYHREGNTHLFSPNRDIEYFLKNPSNVKFRYKMTCCVSRISQWQVTLLTGLPDIPAVTLLKKLWPQGEKPRLYQIVRLFVAEYNPERKILKLLYNKPPKETNSNIINISDISNLEENSNEDIMENETEKQSKIKKRKKNSEIREKNCFEETKEQNHQSPLDQLKSKESTLKSEKKSVPDNFICNESSGANKRKNIKLNTEADDRNKISLKRKKIFGDDNENNQKTVSQGEESDPSRDNIVLDDRLKENKTKKDKSKNVTGMEKLNNDDSRNEMDESDLDTSDFDSDEDSNEIVQSSNSKTSANIENDMHEEGKACKNDNKQKKNDLGEKHKITNQSISQEDTGKIESETIKPTKTIKPRPTLSETGFLWDVKPEDLIKPEDNVDEANDEDEESNTERKKKKTPAERRQAAKEEEARLRQVEQTLVDSENNPQSADQFDRAVLARPDDDELWIKYMSHHLQATEIEKARAVARRALQTINQRLEVERLNIWIALLNLENLFGTQESLKKTLDDALRTNDEFSVYSKMLSIYSQAKKAQEAEQLVHTVLRKFRESFECWVQCCGALMSCGLTDKARNLLQRAISALPPKQHVNLLCKFALLENQHGNSEQSQTLFEHILTTYPKRTDIWNVYVDMLVKSEKVNVARQILERATKQKLPPRKMKMLFNKWISFEEKNGTPEKVDYVRKQALVYVNNITHKIDD